MSQRQMTPPPGIDRISALPDDMLIHILSFLPTKLAFTTTVLSKRWAPLFHKLTTFYFDDEGAKDDETCLRFRRFVDIVLLSPGVQHQPIETFCLRSQSRLCNDLREWVEAAKRRGVKSFELSSSRLTGVPMLPGIFTSQTLVMLKLNGVYVGGRHFGPVDLPSLKTLHLAETCFDREDFKKLLSGCPILVDLYAPISVLHHGYRDTTGYKTLPKLEKACIRALHVPFTLIYNVEFLRIEKMYVDEDIDSCYKRMPVFHNLISLELCFKLFSGWGRVVEVLSYCPKLQNLGIEKQSYPKSYRKNWAYTEQVPECVALHLRTCSIRDYQTRDDDSKFAEFILLNASVLQTMTLQSGSYTEEDEKYWVSKHLSMCPRISPECKIFLNTNERNNKNKES